MREVTCMEGESFSTLIPGASAAKSVALLEPFATVGTKASVNTTMPNPPSHCIIALQNRMPWVCWSTFFKIVEPVVVNPEMVSKKASVMLSIEPLNKKGSIPNRENRIHESETITKVSSLSIFFFRHRPQRYSPKPTIPVMAAVIRKTR